MSDATDALTAPAAATHQDGGDVSFDLDLGIDDDLLQLLPQEESRHAAVSVQSDSGANSVDGDVNGAEGGDDDLAPGSGLSGAGAPPNDDDASLMTLGKSQAKKLGKKLYKKWKKLQKLTGSGRDKKEKNRSDAKHRDSRKAKKRSKRQRSGDSDDDEDGGDNDGDAKKSRKAARKPSRRHASTTGGKDNEGSAADSGLNGFQAPLLGDDEALSLLPKQRAPGRASRSTTTPRRLSAEAQKEAAIRDAKSVVAKIQEARKLDEQQIKASKPPLYRIAIKSMVEAKCRRQYLVPFLIQEGILEELSLWLYDPVHRSPGALELRTAALDILLTFPIEGEVEVAPSRNGEEDLEAFTGLSREHLIHTSLGRAVNKLRLSPLETKENRPKTVALLERLSRAMSGGVQKPRRSSGSSEGGLITWKCKGDRDVAPPFEVVETATEAFQKALVRPDPLDPMSYLRVPPFRPQKTFVTNLSGTVGFSNDR